MAYQSSNSVTRTSSHLLMFFKYCFSSQCEKILATGNEFGYVVSSLYFSQILNLPPTNLSKSSQTFDFHGHFLVLNNLTNNPLESIWKLYNFCYQNCSDLLWEKNCSSDLKKSFEIRGWRPRICKNFLDHYNNLILTLKGHNNFS